VGRWHEQSVTGGRLQVIEALCRMAKLVVALAWLKENGRRPVIVERSKRKNLARGRPPSRTLTLPSLWTVVTGGASMVGSGGTARQRGRRERGESRDRPNRCEWRK
jgi:hypothetical protein